MLSFEDRCVDLRKRKNRVAQVSASCQCECFSCMLKWHSYVFHWCFSFAILDTFPSVPRRRDPGYLTSSQDLWFAYVSFPSLGFAFTFVLSSSSSPWSTSCSWVPHVFLPTNDGGSPIGLVGWHRQMGFNTPSTRVRKGEKRER